MIMKLETVARKYAVGVLSALLLLAVAPDGFAQTVTATLTGTVTDTSGSAIPNASVTLINESSGDIRERIFLADRGQLHHTQHIVSVGTGLGHQRELMRGNRQRQRRRRRWRRDDYWHSGCSRLLLPWPVQQRTAT